MSQTRREDATNSSVDAVVAAVVQSGVGHTERALASYLDYLFRDVEFSGRRVLDVGAGTGFVGLYCLARGAERLTALEPEAAGSTDGSSATLESLAGAVGLADRATLAATTLQEFDAPPESFDLIVLHNSINHLDEPACIELRESEDAQRKYEDAFRRLFRLAAPGADLVITDAARRNFFALLHVKNPLAPDIEWHLHQGPRTWAPLLERAGFRTVGIRWAPFGRLGRVGRIVAANAVAAYFLHSQFILRAAKSPAPGR